MHAFSDLRAVETGVSVEDAFWSHKLKIFREVTLPDVLTKLEKDGAISNYEKVIAGEGKHQGCPWHDGLLMETLRGASDYLRQQRDPALEARIDAYAAIVQEAQLAAGGGYLSTYTLLDRPHQRYGENGGNIQWQHDLYNCGCLVEAGVHHYRATGKTVLLTCALRCANELAAVLGEPPRKWVVPGHSLPEYAMLELYALTRDDPDIPKLVDCDVRPDDYLRLAEFWVRGRGVHAHRTNGPVYLGEYAQDHAPAHAQYSAVGHAVRAMLYYTGITRLAIERRDAGLLEDSLRLWRSVADHKLYINGGVGATHFEEKLGADYDLPNDGYLETCASVGLIFWAKALHDATGKAEFYDVIERALYNIMLSSVALHGTAYFYRNPLASTGNDHHWAWHGCPCCPPMILKLFGAFDTYVYSTRKDACFVNLYVSGKAIIPLDHGHVVLDQSSGYPWDGRVTLRVSEGAAEMLALRIPAWARDACIEHNGQRVSASQVDGYAHIGSVQTGDVITLNLPMPVTRVQAHPYVRQDRGHAAIQRGPIVYCLEGIDNNGEVDVELPPDPCFREQWQPELLGGVITVCGKTIEGKPFHAVPLFVWDNRMAGAMQVWLRQQGMPDGWNITGWEQKLYRAYDA